MPLNIFTLEISMFSHHTRVLLQREISPSSLFIQSNTFSLFIFCSAKNSASFPPLFGALAYPLHTRALRVLSTAHARCFFSHKSAVYFYCSDRRYFRNECYQSDHVGNLGRDKSSIERSLLFYFEVQTTES